MLQLFINSFIITAGILSAAALIFIGLAGLRAWLLRRYIVKKLDILLALAKNK